MGSGKGNASTQSLIDSRMCNAYLVLRLPVVATGGRRRSGACNLNPCGGVPHYRIGYFGSLHLVLTRFDPGSELSHSIFPLVARVWVASCHKCVSTIGVPNLECAKAHEHAGEPAPASPTRRFTSPSEEELVETAPQILPVAGPAMKLLVCNDDRAPGENCLHLAHQLHPLKA